MEETKVYKAEYKDENFEMFCYCDNDEEALEEARKCEIDHGELWNLSEVNEDYEEIRVIF